jgi:oxaloacetate decarboxylase alpha subunit
MNLKEIKEMMKLMNEYEMFEVEIEREGVKLKLKKGMDGAIVPMMHHAPAGPAAHTASAPVVESPSAAAPSRSSTAAEINSPMVGTFYRSPSPEAPPFVEIGQMVDVGQVVCIVEAMKLMNEIKSEVKGKVVDVLVNNAEPVEFGQTLFLVEPA